MAAPMRVKLFFACPGFPDLGHSDGYWFFIDTKRCNSVDHLLKDIASKFELSAIGSTYGIEAKLDGAILPRFESICVLRDGDEIR